MLISIHLVHTSLLPKRIVFSSSHVCSRELWSHHVAQIEGLSAFPSSFQGQHQQLTNHLGPTYGAANRRDLARSLSKPPKTHAACSTNTPTRENL